MNITIGRKMALMIVATTALTISALSLAIVKYRGLLSENRTLLGDTTNSLLTLKNINIEIEKFRSKKSPEPIQSMRKFVEDFERQTVERKKVATKTGDRQLLQNVSDSEIKISDIKKKIDEVYTQRIPNIDEWTDYVAITIKTLIQQVEVFTDDITKRLENRTNNVQKFIIIVVAIMVVMIIVLSAWISANIVGPTSRLINTMSTIHRDGDLTKTIVVKSRDEMGILAETFNNLITSLNSIVKQIYTVSIGLESSSKESVNSATQLTESASIITGKIQGIANGTTVQAKQVEKTSQVIEQLLISISRVATRSATAAEKTTLANQLGEKGGKATKETIAKMQQIQSVVNNSAVVIRRLGDQSKQIGQIVDVITKIAEETNLLALNTAIEAARAGESASGFGVVAEEVRKLAEGTAKAADQITKLVKDIQFETAKAVTSIEAGIKEVTEGTEVVNRTAETLDELVKVVWEATSLANEISKVTQDQSASCEQVRKAMGAITTVADENLHTSEEALKLTQREIQLAKAITNIAQELNKMSEELSSAIKRFKV